jgi:hypothetical protein
MIAPAISANASVFSIAVLLYCFRLRALEFCSALRTEKMQEEDQMPTIENTGFKDVCFQRVRVGPHTPWKILLECTYSAFQGPTI